MSASTLLAKTPLPRTIAGIYDPQGGASGVTSLNTETGDVTLTAAGDVTITTTAPGQIEISSTATVSPPTIVIDTTDIGVSAFVSLGPGATPLTDVAGGSYAPVVLTPGKTYTVWAEIGTTLTTVAVPGGFIQAQLRISNSGGAPQSFAILAQREALSSGGQEIISVSSTFVAPPGVNQLDVAGSLVTIGGSVIDGNTDGSVVLSGFSVKEW